MIPSALAIALRLNFIVNHEKRSETARNEATRPQPVAQNRCAGPQRNFAHSFSAKNEGLQRHFYKTSSLDSIKLVA